MSASTITGQSGQTASTRKPLRILVVQLTRLGDTLQSLMALRAAKQLYPEIEISFVARERFAAAAKRVPWLHQVYTLPTDQILGPVLKGERTERQSLGDIARWIAPLVHGTWDMVINWSYSESSSYLTAVLPARIKLGYSRRKDLSFSSPDGWSHYIQAIVQGRSPQNIHLTDILTTQLLTALQIHIGDPANDGNSPVTSKSFFSLTLNDEGSERLDTQMPGDDFYRKWIAIQLGAGDAAKTWAPEKWARTAAMILRKHPETRIVLLGGNEDIDRARAFQAEFALIASGLEKNLVSLVGESDFDLWASVVSRCQWVLAGDTSVTHLASVLGTRVLNVSIGPVRWEETGPYGNGHYVISGDVSPESVYATWAYGASEWSHQRNLPIETHFEQLGASASAAGVEILRSKIRSSNDGGGVVYEPLFQRPVSLESWTSMAMGYIARSWYCGWTPELGKELPRESVSPALVQKLRELQEASIVLGKVCDEAVATASALHGKSQSLKSEKIMRVRDRDELQRLGQKLLELDQLLERTTRTHTPLLAFSQMIKVLLHNLKSTQLSELGKESAECYRQISGGIDLLKDWIQHTLDLARPMAVVIPIQQRSTRQETNL